MNHDFSLIPQLHPFVVAACTLVPVSRSCSNVFHLYTDGSCKGHQAGWAFAIVCEQRIGDLRYFWRVGFAAGPVVDDVGPQQATSQDAEATAIIAMMEYLLSKAALPSMEIHCHFDATAVGFGAFGIQNLIQQSPMESTRMRDARILTMLVQQRAFSHVACHVHGHVGQPWNECADSLARLARQGWTPPIPAVLRSKSLLRHPLAEWAWIEASPNRELPGLEAILHNVMPQPNQGQCDAILHSDSTQHNRAGRWWSDFLCVPQ